ncbi:MAG: hypothetical protein HY369_00105 [Candidatus Aenigmarchaeota archaeon]|nr:hypothetical protein [Candidatus Aenigmarchaeota archaeon]
MGKHLLVVAIAFLLLPSAAAQVTVTRAVSGSSVTLSYTVSETLEGLIISEALPAGWALLTANPAADKENSTDVKWILIGKAGISSGTITYTVNAPTPGAITGFWKAIDSDGDIAGGVTTSPDSSPVATVAAAGGGGSGPAGGTGTVNTSVAAAAPSPETACTAGSRQCNGTVVIACVGGQWQVAESCPDGCESGICVSAEIEDRLPLLPQGPEITARILADSPAPAAMAVGVAVIAGVLLFRRHRKKARATPVGYQWQPPSPGQ